MFDLEFYSKQSEITDPIQYAPYFEDLPGELDAICQVIQGVLLHVQDSELFQYKIPEDRKVEVTTKTVVKMLEKIFKFNNFPLLSERHISEKMICTCRDFSVLACSIFRHKKIPSRIRFGFSTYYFKEFFHDIVLFEYWDFLKKRWRYVDVRSTHVQIQGHHFQKGVDLHDISNNFFIPAAKAWLMCRRMGYNARLFGSGKFRQYKGLWYVRNKLMQDLAALNKVEMLPSDCWGYMLHNKMGVDPYDDQELITLDHIAEIISENTWLVWQLQELYAQKYLRVYQC